MKYPSTLLFLDDTDISLGSPPTTNRFETPFDGLAYTVGPVGEGADGVTGVIGADVDGSLIVTDRQMPLAYSVETKNETSGSLMAVPIAGTQRVQHWISVTSPEGDDRDGTPVTVVNRAVVSVSETYDDEGPGFISGMSSYGPLYANIATSGRGKSVTFTMADADKESGNIGAYTDVKSGVKALVAKIMGAMEPVMLGAEGQGAKFPASNKLYRADVSSGATPGDISQSDVFLRGTVSFATYTTILYSVDIVIKGGSGRANLYRSDYGDGDVSASGNGSCTGYASKHRGENVVVIVSTLTGTLELVTQTLSWDVFDNFDLLYGGNYETPDIPPKNGAWACKVIVDTLWTPSQEFEEAYGENNSIPFKAKESQVLSITGSVNNGKIEIPKQSINVNLVAGGIYRFRVSVDDGVKVSVDSNESTSEETWEGSGTMHTKIDCEYIDAVDKSAYIKLEYGTFIPAPK